MKVKNDFIKEQQKRIESLQKQIANHSCTLFDDGYCVCQQLQREMEIGL